MNKFFLADRDRDFLRVCNRLRAEKGLYRLRDIASMARHEAAESFYVTTKHYVSIILAMRRGLPTPKHSSGLLYRDVFERYKKIRSEHPDWSVTKIAEKIDELPAPRFYLSEAQATKILYRLYKNQK